MSKKIFLSPSNQTDNIYSYGNTNESIQCGKIADACKDALIRNGFDVKVSHTESIEQKCIISNEWGADLHIPIHTNAFNGIVTGTRMFYYNDNGEGNKACKTIFDVLAPFTPGTSENIKANTTLYEMRIPKAPSVYIEVDFHDVPKIAKWIIENTETIGEKIAEGICKHYNTTYVPKNITLPLYRVQIGAYNVKSNAEAQLEKAKAAGFTDAFISETR